MRRCMWKLDRPLAPGRTKPDARLDDRCRARFTEEYVVRNGDVCVCPDHMPAYEARRQALLDAQAEERRRVRAKYDPGCLAVDV